jgi:hypothetical protein
VRPNYAARRLAAACVAVCVLAVGAVALSALAGALGGVLDDLGGRPAAASEIGSGADGFVRSHVAAPGDTLWSIAEHYRGGVDRDRYIDALEALNGGSAIQVGQAVRLP